MKKFLLSIFCIFFFTVWLSGKDSISVYIFLLDECRICQETAPELNALYLAYGNEIGFIGLFPNFSSKKQGIEAFKEKYNIKFNTKTDYFKTQAQRFEATILPEVIVYNETQKYIIYRGAINDLFYTPGKRRQIVSKNYLRDALIASSNGKQPPIKVSQPIGCFINYNDALN